MGAFLFVLLNLLLWGLPGERAFAGSLGSVPSIGATQAVGGNAPQSSTSAAVQTVAAPVKAVTQTVNKATEPVGKISAPDANKVSASVTGTVGQSVGQSAPKTVAPVLNTATQTAHKAVAPTLQTASKTVANTAAPIVKTATTTTQSVGKTVAPVLDTAKHTVGKPAVPILETATHTVSKATAPTLRTAAQTVGDLTAPAGGSSSSSPAAPSRPPMGARADASPTPASVTTTRTPSTPASYPSNSQTGHPAAPPSGLPACATALGSEEVLETCNRMSSGRLSALSIDRLAQIGIGAEPPAATATFLAAHNDQRVGATGASSTIPPAPAPSPLPGGSLGAMASGASAAFSIFFLTLVGLLLMGGLAAMRLLRLASEPWRVAPFVLIPERPG